MSDWVKDDKQDNAQGSVAAAVAAAAAEVTALSEYDYIPELDVHFDKTSGYFFKQGRHDFHHANSHYTYHFDESSSNWECSYEPDWDDTVGCSANLDAYVLLQEVVDKVENLEIGQESNIDADGRMSPMDTFEDEFLPCIRAIVLESDILPYGHLSIITVDGATIAPSEETEDDESGLMVMNENSEKALCRLRFDVKLKVFQLEKILTEGGDEEGELVDNSAVLIKLNDVIIEKEIANISHQDRLSIDCHQGSFIVLSLHIHKASNTCAGCEPGLLLSHWTGNITTNESSTSVENNHTKSKNILDRDRRRELKRIKKKYALSRVDYVQDEKPQRRETDDSYTDRAEIRRRTIGSDLPESAAVAAAESKASTSITKPMDEANKGYRMLEKMGWKKGAGVGRNEDGIQQPICPVAHMDSSGLGAHSALRVAVGDVNQAQKRFKWSKAAQRYAKLEKNLIFDNENA